jgi:plastocyanin
MKQESGILTKVVLLIIGGCIIGCTPPEERAKQVQEAIVTKIHIVVIQQMKFTPAELTVNKGDSVTWINRDIVEHTVTEETNKQWSSGNLPSGKSWSMVVMKSANYFCTLHPVMKASLVVK